MSDESATPRLSAVIVLEEGATVDRELFDAYRAALDALGSGYEVIAVAPAGAAALAGPLEALARGWPQMSVLTLRPWRGPDPAAAAATRRARGAFVMFLASWREVAPAAIPDLMAGIAEADMAVGARRDPSRSWLQRLRVSALNGAISRLFKLDLSDVFCRARVGRRALFEEIGEFGVRQHFLPLIAIHRGYKVREVPVEPAAGAPGAYRFRLASNVAALFDVLALYVALNFVRRPLRFFGAVGVPVLLAGLLMTAWLVFERLVLGEALAARPALVFGVIAIVLGVQIVALGLVGEIIVFASSRRLKNYDVERVIAHDGVVR